MSPPLKQLQENFQAYILDGNDAIKSEIISTDNAPTNIRLDVYRNGYRLRLLEILSVDFPVIKKLVGEGAFDKLGLEYIDAYPSNHFSVRLFGRHFNKFLASHPNSEPILPEMATFEWRLSQIQDAADAPQLTIEGMSKISPESWAMMRFMLHPTVQWLPFFYNTPDVWKAIDQDQEKPAVTLQETPIYWLFWRYEHEVYFAPIAEQELMMIKAIQAGKTFGEICEELCEELDEEQVIQFAAGTLRTWVGDGIFSEVNLESGSRI
jgi:hypothetical protein